MATDTTFLDDYRAPGGAMSFFSKHSQPGDTVTGRILDVYQMQVTDYMTGQPKTWDNGDPQMQIIIKIQTDLQNDADDDGQRSIYIKTWGRQWNALWEAAKAIGARKLSAALRVGAEFTATYVREEAATKPGLNATKVYEYRISAGTSANLDAFTSPQASTQATPSTTTQQGQGAPQQPQAGATPPPSTTTRQASQGQQVDPGAQARQMIAVGLPDEQIAAATGLDVTVIAALRQSA